ncbi:hypothetical protein LCGC14_0767280 [marine sediment metagenome]|uniref:Histidine kinase N-terminal 7TM region domain-containing protein n=1 Tax=marine sediment metagenome TaxID=412755 RepID=A0A0F9Q3I2_9ZZZZ
MVSFIGWIDGLTATLIILSSVSFGLISLYKSVKLKAKLLSVAGIAMIFVGFLWLGPTVDLFLVLLTRANISPVSTYSILSYLWVAPALVFSIYLGGELIFPKRKWIFVGIFIVLGVIFEFFLWFQTTDSFTWILDNPGEDLIDASFVRTHPTFLMVAVFLVATLVFEGIGFFIKAKQSTGELRKKFFYLGFGFTLFVVCGALDSIIPPGIAIGFVRVVMSTFSIWMYLGLKT